MAYAQLPKFLFHPQFKCLSNEAKLLYALLLDRSTLSAKNSLYWTDRQGLFIYFKQSAIAAILGRSLPTVRRLLIQLADFGLIVRHRQGLTKPDKIYVNQEVDLLHSGQLESKPSSKNQESSLDGKPLDPNDTKVPNPEPDQNQARPCQRYRPPKKTQLDYRVEKMVAEWLDEPATT